MSFSNVIANLYILYYFVKIYICVPIVYLSSTLNCIGNSMTISSHRYDIVITDVMSMKYLEIKHISRNYFNEQWLLMADNIAHLIIPCLFETSLLQRKKIIDKNMVHYIKRYISKFLLKSIVHNGYIMLSVVKLKKTCRCIFKMLYLRRMRPLKHAICLILSARWYLAQDIIESGGT